LSKHQYGITHLFHRLRLPRFLKPAVGGLLVGLIGLVIPQTLGMGYGWIQVSMGKGLLDVPLWVILALPLAKIVTTSLSVGSGGSGGIFGPGMVIGAMTGALFWRLCYHLLPGLPETPGPFVIVGMMTLFGGIAHAPIAVMLMVAEMTGNLSLLAPAMIAVSLAYLLVGRNTIYTSQVETRADSPAHRLQFTFPLLSTLTVSQAMTPCLEPLRSTQQIIEAEAVLKTHGLRGTPVLGDQGELLGTITQTDIERVPESQRGQHTVSDIMNRQVLVFHPAETLDTALAELTTHHVSWAPVLSSKHTAEEMRVIGILGLTQIVQVYQKMKAQDGPYPEPPD
jgi:CIC family chloride channel protein